MGTLTLIQRKILKTILGRKILLYVKLLHHLYVQVNCSGKTKI